MASMVGYMSEGIEAISFPLMNVLPELFRELYDLMMNRKLNEAIIVHKKLYKRIWELLQVDSDLRVNIDMMLILRRELEKIEPTIKLGPMRRPHLSMNHWLL
ncbi:uncharacterized protein LOC116346191 [Contarinia nasturtii]|uniref:uncharacterized protein LOC116346191 n=1 Tax=Contarinia nasturtii TaxID=265458 RepID=UPI0012D43E79|nr:uncharacterized protein LOC116346191 [Contarinia nasturtii]